MKLPTIKINITPFLLKLTTMKGRYKLFEQYQKIRKFLKL